MVFYWFIFVFFLLIQIADYCLAAESDEGVVDANSKDIEAECGPNGNDFGWVEKVEMPT